MMDSPRFDDAMDDAREAASTEAFSERATEWLRGLAEGVSGLSTREKIGLAVAAVTVSLVGSDPTVRAEARQSAADVRSTVEMTVGLEGGPGEVEVSDDVRPYLDALLEQSPSARQWWQEINEADVHVMVDKTSELYRFNSERPTGVSDSANFAQWNGPNGPGWGEVRIGMSLDKPMFDEEYDRFIEMLPEWSGELQELREQEIMATLAHELGHAVEQARSYGTQSCEDPSTDPGETLSGQDESCIMERENTVRGELGLAGNPVYGVDAPPVVLIRQFLHEGRDPRPVMRALQERSTWGPSCELQEDLKAHGYDVEPFAPRPERCASR